MPTIGPLDPSRPIVNNQGIMEAAFRIFTLLLSSASIPVEVSLKVDSESRVIDSFPDTDGKAVTWTYVVSKSTAARSGVIRAVWNASDNTFDYGENPDDTQDIGDTSDVAFDVGFAGNNVRLQATAFSDGWTVKAARVLL